VIAGRLNRNRVRTDRLYQETSTELTCWPQDTTSDVGDGAPPPPPPAPAPPPPPEAMMAMAQDIVVTGALRQRSMKVQQEDLGDLKLYRVPEPVTVAANAQKQVALLDKPRVPVALVYRADIDGDGDAMVRLIVRAQNRTTDGLGLPLPAGKVAVYQPGGARDLLIGEGSVGDKAIGEEVEIEIATATGVVARTLDGVTTVTNANRFAVAFEGRFGERPKGRAVRKDGRWIWAVTVPAGGTSVLK